MVVSKKLEGGSMMKKTEISVYVDGSWDDKQKTGGIAMILVSTERKEIARLGKKIEGSPLLRSSDLEFFATIFGLNLAKFYGFKNITLVHDFEGLNPKYVKGSNSIKFGNRVKQFYIRQLEIFHKDGFEINFKKVKAHAKLNKGGDEFNRQVDRLARSMYKHKKYPIQAKNQKMKQK